MRILKTVCALLILLFVVACNLERFPIDSFDIRFGLNQVGYNFKSDLIQTEDNGYFIVGTSITNDILISKVSEDGTLEYARDNFGAGVAHAIAKTNDPLKPYIVVGSKGDDMFALWIGEQGNQIQLDTFKVAVNSVIGLVDSIAAYDVSINANGEYLITGFIRQAIGSRRLMWMKLTSNGLFDPEAIRTLTSNAYGLSILEGSEDNHFIAGYRDSLLFLNKIDNSGAILWQIQLPDTYENGLTSLARNARGNLFLLGTKKQTGKNVLLLEIDEQRNIVRELQYGTNNTNELGASIAPTFDNAYVILAVSGSVESTDLRISKISDKGEEIWAFTFDNASLANPNVILAAQEYGYALLSLVGADGEYFYRFIKTDADGKTQ